MVGRAGLDVDTHLQALHEDLLTNVPTQNPFNVTKAGDLTDREIDTTWVDVHTAAGGFYALADPRSPMPRILLGGKGSGRTHLMRYYSAPLQLLRAERESRSVAADGYVGIYLRCSGLNSGRFAGKSVTDEGWRDVFAYYMDLWLARLALTTAQNTFTELVESPGTQKRICVGIREAFDVFSPPYPATIDAMSERLKELQRSLDVAVNNASLKRTLDGVSIDARRGNLPFAVPRVLSSSVPALADTMWLFLLDELENLTEEQQRYVQTLVREREPPATLMLGARLYGFRTRRSYSADEDNKAGSEFEILQLDDVYLRQPDAFAEFCRDLVAQRLVEYGYAHDRRLAVDALEDAFDVPVRQSTEFIASTDTTVLDDLRQKLKHHARLEDVVLDEIIEHLAVPSDRVREKVNALLLFQSWNRSWNPREVAAEIGRISALHSAGRSTGWYRQKLRHHKADMHAQLLQRYHRKQRYLGLDDFTLMAAGLPRNVLIILKNVFRWSAFNGERPFDGGVISQAAQNNGVLESSRWFLRDNLPLGELGQQVDASISRLGGFLRALRFVDRPPEVSLSAFTVDLPAVTAATRETIAACAERGLLIPLGDQRDRNDRTMVAKYRLNPMLCPLYDLPLRVGGALRMASYEADAIFATSDEVQYAAALKTRTDRSTVPFTATPGSAQASLLD
jgi:hypothetical protein